MPKIHKLYKVQFEFAVHRGTRITLKVKIDQNDQILKFCGPQKMTCMAKKKSIA